MGLFRYIKNQFRHDRNLKRMISANAASLSVLNREIKQESISRRVDWLKGKVMSCTELGVTDKKYGGEEVIVSLTSFGKRINEMLHGRRSQSLFPVDIVKDKGVLSETVYLL